MPWESWLGRFRRSARSGSPRRTLAAEPLEPRRLLTVFFEDFNGGLPEGWAVVDGSGDGHTWTDQNPGNRTNEHWDGTFIIADDDAAPPNTILNEWLYSPVIDVSGRHKLALEFSHYFKQASQSTGTVQVFGPDSTWHSVATYTQDTAETTLLDISSLADDRANVQIRWHYTDGGTSEWFWGIDNVRLFERILVPDGISGRKFYDRNVNGQRDAGEEYLNGWTIELRTEQGELVATQTTHDIDLDDSGDIDPETESGWYAFVNVTPGEYTGSEILQPGWLQTVPQGLHSVQVVGTESITGLDFGNAGPATVSGVKFEDLDANGRRDPGEPGLAGWAIFRDTNDNGLFDAGEPSTVTLPDDPGTPEDETGSYVFENVPLGAHRVGEVVPDGWDQTFPRYPRTPDRVSVAGNGTQGNRDVEAPAVSADGRFVAFESDSNTLVPDDTDGHSDIFVYDRLLRTTERVSVNDAGGQGNSFSYAPSISADGRYVAFESNASNLVADDTNGRRDVFVYDRQTDSIERVVAADGSQAAAGVYQPSISGDGRFIAFSAERNAFESGTPATTREVYVKDRETGDLTLLTLAHDGNYPDGGSYRPQISPNGCCVVFYSLASDLVANDTNGKYDVFVYDRESDELELVSVASDGITQSDNHSLGKLSISTDGQVVAFSSDATNLLPDDDNGKTDVFVYDRQADTLERVSVDAAGNDSLFESHSPSLSGDGRYVVFDSFSPDFVPGDGNASRDVFLVDRVADTIDLVARASNGSQANGESWDAVITPDGRYVMAISEAGNLIGGDTNNRSDVYVFPGPTADTPDVRAIVIGPDQTITGIDFGNLPRADFGDAPDPDYPTLWTTNGASHVVVPGLSIGANVDIDRNGQPNADATGDDTDDDGDDDDGLRLLDPLIPGQTARVEFPDSPPAAGLMSAWIDFDGVDGWNRPEEQVFADEPWPQAQYEFTVPAWAEPGAAFARFRLSTQAGLSHHGPAPDGEVEDYRLTILPPPGFQMDVTLTGAPTSDPDPITGEVNALPENLEWIDEWTSFYIGIWVTGGGAAVEAASLTLHYNTDYFTAADVQFGPAFKNALDLIEAINDPAGTVQLGGSTTVAGAGDNRPTLLATVHFAASNDDLGLLLSPDGEYVAPATDLDFQIEAPQVNRNGLGEGVPEMSPLPATELWPVMYDMDDNNQVHFSDLAHWAAEFPRFVGDAGADLSRIADFEHNGRVFFEDLSFFAANFGRSKEDPARLIYSPNFPHDWQPQPLRVAMDVQDFRSLPPEEPSLSSTDEKDFGSLSGQERETIEKHDGRRTKDEAEVMIPLLAPSIPHRPGWLTVPVREPGQVSTYGTSAYGGVKDDRVPLLTRRLCAADMLCLDEDFGTDGLGRDRLNETTLDALFAAIGEHRFEFGLALLPGQPTTGG